MWLSALGAYVAIREASTLLSAFFPLASCGSEKASSTHAVSLVSLSPKPALETQALDKKAIGQPTDPRGPAAEGVESRLEEPSPPQSGSGSNSESQDNQLKSVFVGGGAMDLPGKEDPDASLAASKARQQMHERVWAWLALG